jgi:hypothetical protein
MWLIISQVTFYHEAGKVEKSGNFVGCQFKILFIHSLLAKLRVSPTDKFLSQWEISPVTNVLRVI